MFIYTTQVKELTEAAKKKMALQEALSIQFFFCSAYIMTNNLGSQYFEFLSARVCLNFHCLFQLTIHVRTFSQYGGRDLATRYRDTSKKVQSCNNSPARTAKTNIITHQLNLCIPFSFPHSCCQSWPHEAVQWWDDDCWIFLKTRNKFRKKTEIIEQNNFTKSLPVGSKRI